MGFFSDLKKAKKKIDKAKKSTAKPVPKTKPVKEEQEHEKTWKLTKFVKEAWAESDVFSIEEGEDGGYEVFNEEDVKIGKLPASSNTFLENHFDDLQDIDVDEDGTATATFIW